MLNDLIAAYQFHFYKLNFKKYWEVFKKHKSIPIVIICYILFSLLPLLHYYLHHTNSVSLMGIWVVVTVSVWCWASQYVVKRYRTVSTGTKNHLAKVAAFLQTAIPDLDLFHEAYVDVLIARLTKHVETQAPFSKTKKALIDFGKILVLPTIGYVFGILSKDIGQLDHVSLIVSATTLLIYIGLFYGIICLFVPYLQKFLHRDYSAAQALLEDLLDIKLRYFTSVKDGVPLKIDL